MRAAAAALAGLLVCCSASAAHADPVWPRSYADGATRKLGRGVANVFSGPLELIRYPRLIGRREGVIAGGSVGLAQGIRWLFKREVAGMYEIATFWAPVPKGFQPVVLPEFVFGDGEWTPLPE